MKFSITLLGLLLFSVNSLKAQLSFPNGSTLNLETHLDYVYFETMIKFNTGHNSIYDYKYEKIYDSLNTKWFVTACFNGDCHNALEQSGNFINIIGSSDTTGFIAFHVETFDTNGKSAIAYRVINTKDTTDQAVLTFHIKFTYEPSGIQKSGRELNPSIWPNPASDFIQFGNEAGVVNPDVRIFSEDGKVILSCKLPPTDKLDISALRSGVYYVRLNSSEASFTRKVFINR